MRYCSNRRNLALAVGTGLLCGSLAMRAELADWVQGLAVESGLQRVFFRTVPMPAGPVEARRPPTETRAALTELIGAKPADQDLYRLRGSEAELALDFAAAEADWRKYAELLPDRRAGQAALADFYHRRARPAEEIQALDAAASAPLKPGEQLKPAEEQYPWQAFRYIQNVVREQGLPAAQAIAQYRLWIARYPRQRAVYQGFFNYLVEHKQYTAAARRIDAYREVFPGDIVEPVRAQAFLAEHRDTPAQALAVYSRAFTPRMPAELLQDYFTMLKSQGKLRDFLAAARQQAEAEPQDIAAAARVFHYYQQQSNGAAARQTLLEFANRHKNWTADEHFTAARLFQSVPEYEEAARHYYALYTLPGADAGARERGLGGLAALLLAAPEQSIHFGAGNLSYYRDIATIDPYPGFLNGILSLLLNSAQPRYEYPQQDAAATAYFHRAHASELIHLFDTQFPKSPRRAELHERLIEVYAAYGDNQGVLRAGQQFLSAFANDRRRTGVWLLMADAYARQKQPAQEFAVYDRVLKELAARAGGVPLGSSGAPEGLPQRFAVPRNHPAGEPQERSPEYAQVLDRYISRLLSVPDITGALEVYRREIDRNPQDPGLYERLAAFLDQNHMGTQVEQVYQRAIQRFPGASWEDKLARWYLRERRTAEFDRLTRQVATIFSGTELERYFRDVVEPAALDARLYLQVNRYAHERFPNDLAFVRNLLGAYLRKGTADGAAYTRLLRAYWFLDDGLRTQFFEALSSAGKLNGELAAVRAAGADAAANPAAADFLAEGEAWRSHFEAAAPWMRALSESTPGNLTQATRAAALYRSLAAFDAKDTAVAAALAVNMHRYDPGNRDTLARIGDIYADRDLLERARPYWNRMAQTAPGNPAGYLDAATVFWDYYRYDDALRLLDRGRTRLGDPNLYAYEEGAIYESKRDYVAAVREYTKGALGAPDSAAAKRLMKLVARPALRPVAEELTLNAISATNPSVAALQLRVAVLDAQKREADLASFLSGMARRESSAENLAWIETTAANHQLTQVRELALQRQIDTTHDPVEKIRLRLALVQFYESAGQEDTARRSLEAVHAENPAILGVVRAAVDFYWRHEMPAQAIETLTHAAAAANADYGRQFTLEAARKATDSGEYARARALLAPLLQADPYNAAYLAASAETWAQAGDDQGLRDSYSATIQALQQAPLAAEERSSRIAGMRRGLIPALTRLRQYPAAVDQYIEIVNRYPEDEALVREAAAYGIEHQLQPRFLTYYTRTAAESPRDYRWPLVLARLETHFEDFPAAIAAYSRAVVIRPDRMDLFTARATLEERLMRFDDAVAGYQRIYELSYRDPQWLVKAAAAYARLQRSDAAVETLRKALIGGRPERPDTLFEMARTLESWGLVRQALPFAERGLDLAGTGKWVREDHSAGAGLYTRLQTRVRGYEAAFGRIPADKPELAAAGDVAREYFSPEEMAAFAAFLEKQGPRTLPVAEHGGLWDLETRWRFGLMMTKPRDAEMQQHEQRLVDLETRRMRFVELARNLEAYLKAHPGSDNNDRIDSEAAAAWQASGDKQQELRFLEEHGGNFGRLLELLAQSDPARLVTLARSENRAVQQAVATGPAALAYQAVEARGKSLPPVWSKAYTALVGLYYLDRQPAVDAAFRGSLNATTIGQRLARPANRDRELAGDIWFYYGSRYGEYLAELRDGRQEDYLAASLEAAPGNPDAYAALADFYGEQSNPARALAEYDRALELNAGLGYVYDHAALVLWKAGRRAEAVTRWRSALKAFEGQQSRPNLAEDFWANAPAALRNIGERGLFAELRPEIESLLRSYMARHNWYRLEPLLEPVAHFGGLDLIVDSVTAATDPGILDSLTYVRWLSAGDRVTILRRVLAANPMVNRYGYETRLLSLLVETKQTAAAQAELASMPPEVRREMISQLAPLELQIAARSGKLPELLAGYRRSPETEPPVDALRDAAAELQKAGDAVSARRILDFLYTRELERGHFDAANFLGLAEVRLEDGDTAAALPLLRRMTLIAGEPFENFMPAAELLLRFGHAAEAVEFLAARARAVPWDDEARLQLGEARHSVQDLTALAADTLASYSRRAAAARLLGVWGAPAAPGISGELALLASGKIDASAAEQPYFFAARVAAAETAADPQVCARLLRGALALQPDSVDTRLSVFRAEFAARHDRLAVSAVRALDQARIPKTDFADLATVHENLGEWEEARQALTAAPDSPAIQKRIAALGERIDRAARDAQRRPMIGDTVSQQSLVRPRILP